MYISRVWTYLNEWRFTRGHLNDCAAEWPDVGGRPVPPQSLIYHLRGHVLQRACERLRRGVDAGESLGRTEVRDFEDAAVCVNEYIVTFYVTVNYFVVMLQEK